MNFFYDLVGKYAAGGMGEKPIDGQTGVWVKAGAVTLSSAMKMTGAIVESAQSQYVYNSGLASECAVNAGAVQYVSSGGEAIGCVTAGVVYVYDAAVVSSANIVYAGSTYVSSGGLAVDTTASGANARLYVYPRGFVSNTTVNAGRMVVYGATSAVADSTTVTSGGYLMIYGSGAIANNVVGNSSYIYVYNSGYVNNATLNARCAFYVSPGGMLSNYTVTGGGLFISSGGSAVDGYLSGGSVNVQSAGYASSCLLLDATAWFNVQQNLASADNVVQSGGGIRVGNTNSAVTAILTNASGNKLTANNANNYVYSGGTCIDVILGSRIVWTVSNGGVISNITITGAGGGLYVSNGGLVNSLIMHSGTAQIRSGGTAFAAVVSSGGSMIVSNGGTASDIEIYSGGGVYASSGAEVSDIWIANGANLYVYGGVYRNIINSGGVYTVGIAAKPTYYNIEAYRPVTLLNGFADTVVMHDWSTLTIGAEGSAVNVTATYKAHVNNSGYVSGCAIMSAGTLTVRSGASSLAVTSNAGAVITVEDGGYIEYVTP